LEDVTPRRSLNQMQPTQAAWTEETGRRIRQLKV
jgi:hypothetical protein